LEVWIIFDPLKNGAIGGKITGAGGGGHMLFYCEKPKQKNLEKKITNFGAQTCKIFIL